MTGDSLHAEPARTRTRPWTWTWRLVLAAMVAAIVYAAVREHDLSSFRSALMRSDPEAILADPRLERLAARAGRSVFMDHCASCHGSDAKANPRWGMPDLTDADWLYGEGRVSEIEGIVLHGIRSGDTRGWNLASMPAYGTPRPYDRYAVAPLSPQQIIDVAAYVRSLSGKPVDNAAAGRGAKAWNDAACWDCHGHDARGDSAIGAPNLVDDIWLYGNGSAGDVERSVAGGRDGRSPAFSGVLKPWEARAVSVYVAALSRHAPQPASAALAAAKLEKAHD